MCVILISVSRGVKFMSVTLRGHFDCGIPMSGILTSLIPMSLTRVILTRVILTRVILTRVILMRVIRQIVIWLNAGLLLSSLGRCYKTFF
jgi:hypothetical protein